MTIVPENLLTLLPHCREELEHWFSEQLYAQMLQRNEKHILVQLQQRLAWDRIEAACASYYHSAGPGAKPKHQVGQWLRALVVKALNRWSLRETQARISNDLVVKWFVGYGVLEAGMDYSGLCRFEQWLRAHQPRLLFDTVLGQIDRDFPAEREAVQIGDTFAMEANAAREGWVELLRHLSRNLLRDLAQSDPPLYQQVLSQIEPLSLFGPAHETHPYYLSAAALQLRLTQCVRAALQLATVVQTQLSQVKPEVQAAVTTAVQDLRQVVDQNLALERDAQGQICQVTIRPADQQGTYQLASATDREATIRNHGRSSTLGYNINFAITPRGFIREIFAATGAQPDAVGIPELIQRQIQHLRLWPRKMIYDRAGNAGHTRAQVARVSRGGTQLVARLAAPTHGQRFGPEDFRLSLDERTLTCPAGQTTAAVSPVPDRYGRIFAFKAKTHCQGCPLESQCRNPENKASGARTVFISDYRAEIHQARAYNQTEAFTQDMQLRPRVERVVFMLTHYDGARRATGRGTQAADFQAKMAATGRNLRTWLKFLAL